MALHDRIKEARKLKGFTQTELGERIGVAKTTIAGYEKNREPTAAQLGEIADVLDVDVTFLLQDEIRRRHEATATLNEMEHLVKKYRALDEHGKEMVDFVLDSEYRRMEKAADQAQKPASSAPAEEVTYYITSFFYHPASAGAGEMADIEGPESLHLIKKPPRGTSFVVPVSGDSMEPTYHDGDKLFVRAQEEIIPGQIGIFFMDGKQWVKELGDGVLISHNPEYPPRPMAEDVRCQGLVLGVCDDSYFED